MARVREFVVALENRPGKLGEVTRALARAGVNLEGVGVETPGETGFARLLVAPPQAGAAEHALKRAGFQFVSGDALSVTLPNRPGALADVAERLGRSGVNIEGLYGFATGANEGQAVLRTDDLDAAERALRP